MRVDNAVFPDGVAKRMDGIGGKGLHRHRNMPVVDAAFGRETSRFGSRELAQLLPIGAGADDALHAGGSKGGDVVRLKLP